MRNTFIFPIIMILVLCSFSEKRDVRNVYLTNDTPSVALDSQKWYLTATYNTNEQTKVMTRKAFINFNIAEGKVGGNGSCNLFGGKLTVDKKSLSVKNVFSTKMYCTDVQSIENDFFSRLQKVTRYEIKEKKLLLFEADNLLLELEAA